MLSTRLTPPAAPGGPSILLARTPSPQTPTAWSSPRGPVLSLAERLQVGAERAASAAEEAGEPEDEGLDEDDDDDDDDNEEEEEEEEEEPGASAQSPARKWRQIKTNLSSVLRLGTGAAAVAVGESSHGDAHVML